MKSINKIAIVKLSAMGDIIHAMVTLQFIKQHNPNIQIDWFVESSFAKVLENNPHIDNIIKLELKSIKKNKLNIINQIKLLKRYSSNNYDLIIDAQGLLKSAIVSRLLGKNVIGFDKNSIREKLASVFYNKKVSIAYDKNVIDRNIELFKNALEFKISKDDIFNKKPFLFFDDKKSSVLSSDKKNIVLVIGASWDSKMYPKEKFVNIVNSMDENFIIVWGNDKEYEIAKFIESHSKAIVSEKLDLDSLKCLIFKSDLLIGNDTGPTHMAWALNIPSITLFGNTPSYRNTYETAINKTIDTGAKINPYKLDREDFCIKKIEEEKIVNLAKILLKN